MKEIKRKIINFIKEEYKSIIVLIIVFLLFYIELPYKIYTPGGMVNLASRVEVENGYSSSGVLGMSYVSLARGSIPNILLSKIIPDWDLAPESELKYDNETMEEKIAADKIATQESIDHAIISAYTLSQKEIKIESENVFVTYIDPKADTDLKILDQVLKVDNQEIKNTKKLREIVTKHKVGDKIKIIVKRDNKEKECSALVFDFYGPKIGIAMTLTYNYQEEPKASIKMKQSESGPSGGLMMSLAIYNALNEEDITGGKTIVGTGTIDLEGNVGSIGGVKYKLIGAVNKKADIFLVPSENYEEALEVKNQKNYDIKIISVKTLKEAVEELKKQI